MREILFRGKRCDNGEWAQGFYARADHHWHNNGIHKDWIICSAVANGGWFVVHNKYAVKKETLGQYTGLTDKNGKKIFEGDVLSGYFSAVVWVNGLVEFKDGSFGISWKLGDGRQFAAFTSITHSVEFEIIGNIHDNPELLEVSHE